MDARMNISKSPVQSIERLSYTIEQFMTATGYSRRKVYEAIARGDLRSFKDGKRRMISAQAARDFIAAREQATADGHAI
jgi:hypothetical protein